MKKNQALSLFICQFFIFLLVGLYPDNAILPDEVIKIPETVLVEAGSFTMGMNMFGANGFTGATPFKESPAHQVTMSPFYIGKYEVTNEEYAEFVDAGGYNTKEHWLIDPEDGVELETGWIWKEEEKRIAPRYKDFTSGEMSGWNLTKDPYWKDDFYSNQSATPVIGVSWFEAYAYCKWLSSVTGEHYRLPTEAEWEYAARGPESFIFPWGNEYLSPKEMCGEPGSSAMANCWSATEENPLKMNPEGVAAPVGSYPKGVSPWGVYDMAGNVAEFTNDWFQGFYYFYRIYMGLTKDPPGPSRGSYPLIFPIEPNWTEPCRAVRSTGFAQSGTSRTNYNPSSSSYPLRCSHRMFTEGFDGYNFVGFRVLQEVERNIE